MYKAGFERGWTDAQAGRPNDAMRFQKEYAKGYFDGYQQGREALVTGDSFNDVWRRFQESE